MNTSGNRCDLTQSGQGCIAPDQREGWRARRYLIPLAVVLLSGGFASVQAAGESANHTPGSNDPRLQQLVKDTQVGPTLADYLATLSKNTDVEQRVVTGHSKRPLVALGVKMSLQQCQKALAQDVHLTWKTSGNSPIRYTLLETSADRQARIDAANGARRAGREAMMQRLDHIRNLAALSREELTKLAQSGDTKAGAFLHPRGSAMNRLLLQMPPGIWKRLWSEGKSEIAVAALPPTLQDLAKQAAGNDSAGSELGDRYRISDLVVPQGRLVLQFGGSIDRPTIWGTMRYGAHSTSLNLLYAEASLRQPPSARREAASKKPSRVPDDYHLQMKVTLRDRSRSGFIEPGERPAGARPLAEYLQQLADQTGLPVFAECEYKEKDQAWLKEQWWLASDIVNRPLAQALDQLCADFEFQWEFKNGALLLRPIRWYLDLDQRSYSYPNVK